MPAEIVESILGNTYAVKTNMPKRFNKWHHTILEYRKRWVSEGSTSKFEVEFADALLALLKDTIYIISDDNPYKGYVEQLEFKLSVEKYSSVSPKPKKPFWKRFKR